MVAESAITELGLSPAEEKAAWEARARITWGDQRNDVRQWLVESGLTHVDAAEVVRCCIGERAASIRRKGVRDLVLGLMILAVNSGLILLVVGMRDALQNLPARAPGIIVGVSGSVAIYGIYLTVRGVERMIGGAKVAGADSDVGDLWE